MRNDRSVEFERNWGGDLNAHWEVFRWWCLVRGTGTDCKMHTSSLENPNRLAVTGFPAKTGTRSSVGNR